MGEILPHALHAAELSEKKTARLAGKLNRPPDLVVFEKVSAEGACSECGVELLKGKSAVNGERPAACLTCADLDRLVFLPAGDAALSRRARKHSRLSRWWSDSAGHGIATKGRGCW